MLRAECRARDPVPQDDIEAVVFETAKLQDGQVFLCDILFAVVCLSGAALEVGLFFTL